MARTHRQPDSQRGFTALEALVSVMVFAVVMLFAVTTFQGTHRMTRSASVQGDSQQSARLAVEAVTKDLRVLGFGVDVGLGQRSLVHASPWDVIFNANATPSEENPAAPGFPLAMDPSRYPATVPAGGSLYVPSDDFRTGAETIRYTIDSSGDGIVDHDDADDDPEEATANPRDYVLRKEIYGAMADNTNGGTGGGVALVRGPDPDPDGTLPPPLFTYWIDDDNDPVTPELLHGDSDGDGRLSQSEIAGLGNVPDAALSLVTRVIVTITAEDAETAGRADYRTRKLVSSVSFRNQIRRGGVITGTVFQDVDGDGRFDLDVETPIPGVLIRLDSGSQFETDEQGRYYFDVQPGTYTIHELDPPGHISTTPNVATVGLVAGSTELVNFGDRAASGIGTISARVFSDDDADGVSDPGERGLEGVVITLNTGARDTTDASGHALLSVPVGSYTVVETDSIGWTSTTPNVVEVNVLTEGDQASVEFGDAFGGSTGRIAGTVFLDEDHDGTFDTGEPGIADVPILLSSGDSTVTNGDGAYSITVSPGFYWVQQLDLEGYSSSTPNVALTVVHPDSTSEIDFGDLYDTSINFTVVTVGTTDRALSVGAGDLGEDNKNDPDIILGTESSGSSNLHVWHNQRKNASTAIVSLFSASPSFSRTTGSAVQAMATLALNDDNRVDAVTGLASTGGSNLQGWITQATGGDRGKFPNSPSFAYTTGWTSSVLSIELVEWPVWGGRALVVGTEAADAGHVEVWLDDGGGLAHQTSSDLIQDAWGTFGAITCVASGDFDGDGLPDLALGQDGGNSTGRVSIFLAGDEAPWTWHDAHVLDTWGAVLALEAVDMKEDDQGDVDLIVGTSMGTSAGNILLWHNDGEGNFGDAGQPSDWIEAGGEVLSLGTATLDPDVFPDVIAGLRTSQYSGALNAYKGTGFLPSTGTEVSFGNSGEVATLTINDFNLDGLADVAVGTRTAFSSGELVIYFGTAGGSAL